MLKSLTVGAFGKGGMSASFQARGTLHSENEVLNISAMGAARMSANSLSTQLGKSSGPLGREDLIKVKETSYHEKADCHRQT